MQREIRNNDVEDWMEKGRGGPDHVDFLSPMGVPTSVRHKREETARKKRIASELEFMFPMPEPTAEELESGMKPQLRKLRRFLLVAIILAVGWAVMRVVSRDKAASREMGMFRNQGYNRTASEDRHPEYVFFPTPSTYSQARVGCAGRGGKLVKIDSEFKNIGVYTKCRASQCWLGLSRGEEGDTQWAWADYPTPTLGDFAPWKQGPGGGNDSSQNCAFVYGAGTTHHAYFRAQWKGAQCGQLRPYVCDVSAGSPAGWAAANIPPPGRPA